jgi:hypothetical protein
MARKKAVGLSETVGRYVEGLRLGGAEEVRAVLARLLAESFEEAPAYARARIAAELRVLVAELEAAGDDANAPRLGLGLRVDDG